MLTKRKNGVPILRSLLISIILITSSSGSAESEVGVLWKTIAGWQIRVDTSLDNSCFLIRKYEDNTILQFGYNKPSQSMYIMVGGPNWQPFEAGGKYTINLRFGNAEPRVTDTHAVDHYGMPVLVAGLGSHEKIGNFIDEFMLKHSVKVEFENKDVARLSLKGSFKGAAVLMDCQKTYDRMGG